MAAIPAVDFLINDHGDKVKSGGSGFRKDFAEDKPIKSILQRQGKTVDQLLEIFDWRPDDALFVNEYNNKNNSYQNLINYRRRVCFCVDGWRDIKEDLDQYDVGAMKFIRTPYVTSRTPLKQIRKEFDAFGK